MNTITKMSKGEHMITTPAGASLTLQKNNDGEWDLIRAKTLPDGVGYEPEVVDTFSDFKEARRVCLKRDFDAVVEESTEPETPDLEQLVVEEESMQPATSTKTKKAKEPDEKKSLRVWLGLIAAQFAKLDELSEADLAKSGIESVRFTKVWVHITFTGAAGMREMADALAELEPSDSRVKLAVKRAIKTLRDAADKAVC